MKSKLQSQEDYQLTRGRRNVWLPALAAPFVLLFMLTGVSGQLPSQQLQKEVTKEAIVQTDKLLKDSPKDFTLYLRRGLIHWRGQDADEATADFQKSITLNPYKPSKKPLSDMEKFQKLELARAYYNLGSIDCFKKQYQAAIPYFTKTIELEPNFPEAYKNRGLAYGRLGNQDLGALDLKKANELFKSPKKRVQWPPLNARGPESSVSSDGQIDIPVSGHIRPSH